MLNFPDSLTHHEINLYKSLKRVIGRHFFFYCLGLSSLGKHEIIPSLCEMVNFFFKNIQLLACTCNTLEFQDSKMPKCFEGFFVFLYPTGTRHSMPMELFLRRFSKALYFHSNYYYQQHHVIPLNIYPEQDCFYLFFIR